jgi:hypothetical protein
MKPATPSLPVLLSLAAACAALAACGDGGGGGTDSGGRDHGAGQCVGATDCDDGDSCTVDRCVAGTCDHPTLTCDDQDPCTTDSCSGGKCQHAAVLGCCSKDAQCDDGDFCTPDRCLDLHCTALAPVAECCNAAETCDDGNVCTYDDCIQHKCVHYPDAHAGCCEKDADCLDGNSCTDDRCTDGQCVYTNRGCCNSDADCIAPDACQVGDCGTNLKCTYTRIPDCCVKDADCPAVTCTTVGCPDGTCKYAAVDGCCTKDEDCGDACLQCTIPFESPRGDCTLKSTPECCTATLLSGNFSDLSGFTVEALADPAHAASPRWVIDGARFASAPTSLYFGDPATHTYEDQAQGSPPVGGRAISPTLDLARTVDPVLTFQVWKATDVTPSTDILSVIVLKDDGSEAVAWSTLSDTDVNPTTNGIWKTVTVPLGAWQGKPARLAFQFDSVDTFKTQYEGTYVDDPVVAGRCP